MFELWRLSHYCSFLRKIRNPVSWTPKAGHYLCLLCSITKCQATVKKITAKCNRCSFTKQWSQSTCYRVGSSLSYGTSYGGHSHDTGVSSTTWQQPGTKQHHASWNIQPPLASDLWTLQMCFPEDSHSRLMVYSISASSQPALNSPLHIWCHFHKKILTCRCYECLRQTRSNFQ